MRQKARRKDWTLSGIAWVVCIGLVMVGGCNDDDDDSSDAAADPDAVQYLLTFNATWSATTHPTDFPADPHFSGLIGASHSDAVRLWEMGGAASPGIKNMAETGSKSPLDSEIDVLIDAGTACEDPSKNAMMAINCQATGVIIAVFWSFVVTRVSTAARIATMDRMEMTVTGVGMTVVIFVYFPRQTALMR